MLELKSTARVEAFSDAVFAIATTLLILEIKVPPIDSIHSIRDLWHSLGHLWPSYFAFAFSFGSILIAWVNHHHVFNTIDKTSRPFMYANGYLLLTITFIPFPTALLAEYIGTEYAQPAIAFYCFSTTLNTTAWYLLGKSVLKPKLLLKESIDKKSMDKPMNSVKLGFVVCSLTTILAFWFPDTALVINFSILIFWIIISLNEKV